MAALRPKRSRFAVGHLALFLAAWTAIIFACLLLAVFLHEDGHGLGARLDGIHISTGLNRIGNPGLTPDDPNFRTGLTGGFWVGLLGPVTSWFLAVISTCWLYRHDKQSGTAIVVGAFAIANGLVRTVPMAFVLLCAFQGHFRMEDEANWGVWYVARYLRPDLKLAGMQSFTLTQRALLLSYPAFWIPVLFSFVVSLACLFLAYRRLLRLWSEALGYYAAQAVFLFAPLFAWAMVWPLLNWLDRVIRINW